MAASVSVVAYQLAKSTTINKAVWQYCDMGYLVIDKFLVQNLCSKDKINFSWVSVTYQEFIIVVLFCFALFPFVLR